ncbi:MAG: hypothetical protein ACI9P8_001947 [Bacteroidia bacterium]|jgi:hypothetical protein
MMQMRKKVVDLEFILLIDRVVSLAKGTGCSHIKGNCGLEKESPEHYSYSGLSTKTGFYSMLHNTMLSDGAFVVEL